jgi:hypothetical protein
MSEEEVRRIEDKYFTNTREPVEIWSHQIFNNLSYVEMAGRTLMYRTYKPVPLIAQRPDEVSFQTINLQFRLERFVHREWIVIREGKDDQGKFEEGFYQLYVAYMPIPWPLKEFKQWAKELIDYVESIGIH